MRPFRYATPTTTDEAIHTLATAPGTARLLAGGTTLVDLMKLDVEQPALLIDITGIPQLREIRTDGDTLIFGALVHMSEVADHPVIKRDYPILSEALWRGASQQLRNMATLGGNLLQRTRCAYFRDTQFPCNKRAPGSGCSAIGGLDRGHALLGTSSQCIATYPGDWAVALVAMDASIDTLSPRGGRSIPVAELHRQPGDTPQIENVLAIDEIIVRTRMPASPLGRASTYIKIRDRESYAFALTSAAVALSMDGNRVRDARIALGGVATVPWRARQAEQSLVGKTLDDAAAHEAGNLAFTGAKTSLQNAFRVPLGVNAVVQALTIAKGRA
jgi:xanthine dehydrogenase YagS FAD-binding subunit